jgi:hypothetical protein
MIDPGVLRQRITDRTCGNRVVFHHVPKCGGTSLNRGLMMRYASSYIGLKAVLPVYKTMELLYPFDSPRTIVQRGVELREKLLLLYMYKDIRCISGHIMFSSIAHETFHNRYRFITILRCPSSLFTSTYFWNATSKQDRWRIDQDIESFLDTDRARVFGSSFSGFFSGLPSQTDPTSRASIEAAKANLRKFAVVGTVERLPAFGCRLREALGVRVPIGHMNKARVGSDERAKVLTPAVRRKIEEVSAVNLEIYEFVRRELAA